MRDHIRTRILKRVEALEKGYRQNIGLIGRAGSGKTHLLNSLFHQLSGQPHLIPIYVDASSLDFDNLIERWVGAMLNGVFLSRSVNPPQGFQSLLSASDLIVPKTTEQIRRLKKMIRREQNASTVRELFALSGILEQETQKKVILIIDEFQELEHLPAPDPFALLGKEIMVEKNTLYLVASSYPAKAREIFRDKLSLLFSNFEVITVCPWTFEEAGRFLDLRLQDHKLSALQKKFLIRMTDGIPIYLELLADQIKACIKSHPEKISEALNPQSSERLDEDIAEAFERELFDYRGRLNLMFENRLEKCRRLGREGGVFIQALLAMSHGRHQVLQMASFMGRKVQETKKILQRLIEQDFISRKGAFFVVSDPLFRFWMREVFQRRYHRYHPGEVSLREALGSILRQEWVKEQSEERVDISSRLEALLKGFRNELVEIDQKKIKCPQFAEIAFRPTNGRVFPLIAKAGNTRWFCQTLREKIHEEDVASFLDELKRLRKKVQQKVMIALGGIEQNAKLMAQQARVQLWDLRHFNELLELYDLPKMIVFQSEEAHEPTLGTVAESLHTA